MKGGLMCGFFFEQIILFSLLFCAVSDTVILNPKEVESFFDSQITEDYRKEYGISSLAVSITQGSETVFFKGYGFQNPSSQTPVTSQTIYGLASISKTFIAVSTVQIFSKDQYADNVNNYLTDLTVPDVIHGNYFSSFGGYPHVKSLRDIQIWNLLTHTEGLDIPLALTYRKQPSSLLEDMQIHLPPRIRQTNLVSTYSNAGASLLGLVIEQNNPKKMEYGEYIKSAIFDPLGMNHSYYGYNEAKKNDPNDVCELTFLSNDGKYETFDNFLGDDVSYQPSAIVYSNSEDVQEYAKTLLLQKNEDFLTQEQHNNLFDPLFIPNQNDDISATTDFKSLDFEDSISSIFYTKVIGPVKWIGHDGDYFPFHSQMMLNFEHNISFILLYTSSSSSFRDPLRRDFTHHFLYTNETIDRWCPDFHNNTPISTTTEKEEMYEKNSGLWRRTFSLQNDFPRDKNEVKKKYEDEYVGCYENFRFPHTTFATGLSQIFQMKNSQFLCLELIDGGKYLGIKQEDEEGQFPISMYSTSNKQDIIFLEMDNDYSVEQQQTNFLITQRRSEDIVELILGDTDPPIASFVFPSDDGGKYVVLYNIYNTLEFYGSKEKVFWSLYFLYGLYTFTTPVFGISIFLCCCCCVCCGCMCCCCDKLVCKQVWKVIQTRRRKGLPLIRQHGNRSINSTDWYFWKKNVSKEYDLIGEDDRNKISSAKGSGIIFGDVVRFNTDDDDDDADSCWKRYSAFWKNTVNGYFEINSCCCIQCCCVGSCVLCVLGFNVLHYLFMYIIGCVWMFPKLSYIPLIVNVGSYMPIGSIICLVFLIVCSCCGCVCWNYCLECCCVLYGWKKGVNSLNITMVPYHRCCHYSCLCICVCFVLVPAILYFVLAGYYNSFAFVDLMKSN